MLTTAKKKKKSGQLILIAHSIQRIQRVIDIAVFSSFGAMHFAETEYNHVGNLSSLNMLKFALKTCQIKIIHGNYANTNERQFWLSYNHMQHSGYHEGKKKSQSKNENTSSFWVLSCPRYNRCDWFTKESREVSVIKHTNM